jgi:hypothetical protein
VGALRVLGDGHIAAVIAYPTAFNIASIDAAAALATACASAPVGPDETQGRALLVHDGTPGREAWRVEVLRAGVAVRFVFVTPGGSYERSA